MNPGSYGAVIPVYYPVTGVETSFHRSLSSDEKLLGFEVEDELGGEMEGSDPLLAQNVTEIRFSNVERRKWARW